MKRYVMPGLAGLLAAVFVFAASCGGSANDVGNAGQMEKSKEDSGGRPSRTTEPGGYSDKRFIDRMIPHHRSAVEMAEVALKKAEHRKIEELSKDIVSTQEAEIKELKDIRREEFGTAEVSSGMDIGHMQGMGTMDAGDLADREPFDRTFIDAMIPHHESAVEMAGVARQESRNPRIKELAEDIIGAQEREISQLRSWREEWYPEG